MEKNTLIDILRNNDILKDNLDQARNHNVVKDNLIKHGTTML